MRMTEPVVYAAYHQVKVDFVFRSTPTIMRRVLVPISPLTPREEGDKKLGCRNKYDFSFPQDGILTEKHCMCSEKESKGENSGYLRHDA